MTKTLKKVFAFCFSLLMISLTALWVMAAEGDNAVPAGEGNVIVDGICYSADMKKIISFTELFTADSFTVPDGVVEIGERAFYGTLIKSIIMADSVEKIDKDAFYRSEIESVTFGKNSKLNEISENAFRECYHLKVIFLPENVEKIASNAFLGCTNLSIVNIWQAGYADSLAITPGNLDLTKNITSTDARLALRLSAKLDNGNQFSVLIGDINRDGHVNSSDARNILRTAAHLQ